MSKSHELAWAAGFFDGEGYITIQRRNTKYKDKTYPGHYLRIGINHVAIEPLKEMQRLFGGTLRTQTQAQVIGNRKPRSMWCLSTNRARDVLIQMMPYFKNKAEVAEVALAFQATMVPNSQKRLGIPSEHYARREDFKTEIKRLNAQD